MVPCWSCKGPVAAAEAICPTCGAVLPPGASDPFARLGLARRFDIDAKALERRYFDLQRRLHPDRFATRGPRERAMSQQQAAAINDAYETLKDPLRRAGCLLRLAGREAPTESEGTIADPELLMEAMEMREALDAAHSFEETSRLAAEADAIRADCQSDLAGAFAAGELDRAAGLVMRLRYLERLADEARRRRNAMG